MSHIFDERFEVLSENRENIIYNEHLVRYGFVQKYVKNKKVLDIASGSGYGSRMLAEAGAQVIGVDISLEAVENAKKNYHHENLEFRVGSGEELVDKDKEFDIVVSFETIEHLKKQDKYLGELARVVREDGLVFISTPNIDVFGQKNPYHFKEYTEDDFQSELSAYFKNVHILKQGNALVSVIEGVGKKNEMNLIDNIKPMYYVAVCSHGSLEGKLPSGSIGSANFAALDNIYTNPGFRLMNFVYSRVVKIPGMKKVLESVKSKVVKSIK